MKRRRRNPTLGEAEGLVVLVAAGVGVYLLYKLFGLGKSAATATTQAFSSASSKVADWLTALLPPAIQSVTFAPNSWIVLPDGTQITSDIVAAGAGAFTATDGSTQIQFYFGGKTYRTAATPDETNTYYATDATGATAPALVPAVPTMPFSQQFPGGA
jgi:hypothetical protein